MNVQLQLTLIRPLTDDVNATFQLKPTLIKSRQAIRIARFI
jgi:hypothetical protein